MSACPKRGCIQLYAAFGRGIWDIPPNEAGIHSRKLGTAQRREPFQRCAVSFTPQYPRTNPRGQLHISGTTPPVCPVRLPVRTTFFVPKRIFLKFFCSFLCFDRIFRAEKRPDLCFARRPNRPFCGPNGRFRHDFRPELEYNSIAAGKYAKKDCTNRGIAKRGGMCYNNDIR